jgi:hypothetical protein
MQPPRVPVCSPIPHVSCTNCVVAVASIRPSAVHESSLFDLPRISYKLVTFMPSHSLQRVCETVIIRPSYLLYLVLSPYLTNLVVFSLGVVSNSRFQLPDELGQVD